jgi:hypothetical protein
VTTNQFNQLTISKSLPAMTLQDNTSSINCMQQLQLNLTQSRLSPAGCNNTTVAMMPAIELRIFEFSHSATAKQQDLQP